MTGGGAGAVESSIEKTLGQSLLGIARRGFHNTLLESGTLSVDARGVPSNADKGSPRSVALARHIAEALEVRESAERLPGQTSGNSFEGSCANYLRVTFPLMGELRPGGWIIEQITRRSEDAIATFEQYAHLDDLSRLVREHRELRAALGNGYLIAPDVVVARRPITDAEINSSQFLVGPDVARAASLRAGYQPRPVLHAVVSCKWTLRSDRAQNARTEALNLIRNRKGRAPHIVVVTGEPLPSRISSLALGTGDVDCMYHFALYELVEAVVVYGSSGDKQLLDDMIGGGRLKDISDLPLDIAT